MYLIKKLICIYIYIYRHCSNGSTTDLIFDFEDAADLKYGWSGVEVCCNCGGGKTVYNDIAISFINNNNFNKTMDECTFKYDSFEININQPFQIWNNFVLYQLIGMRNRKINVPIIFNLVYIA